MAIFAPDLSKGKLYIISTPIGNLGDISYRAVDILKTCTAVLAEDTRQTKKLLDHYQIEKKMIPYHQHNEHRSLEYFVEQLNSGVNYALCSDAGTPGISDPGFLLIRECVKHDIHVESIPGATAVITALVTSGLPCDSFVFEGFLPHKKGKQTKILSLLEEKRTTVFYESPHRIVKSLEMVHDLLGAERRIVVARELTKKFEEYVRGNASEVLEHFKVNKPKGEFVLIIGGKDIE